MSIREYVERLKQSLVPTGGVTERAVKSGVWVVLINVFDRLLQIGKLVVLARLLAPADFGLMGIALLALAVLNQFSKLGFDPALIQRTEENVDEYLNTAWVMKALRGLALGAIAYLIAPFVASFFGEPRVVDLIRVLAVAPVFRGLQNPGILYFRKNLEFHRQFAFKMSETVANVAVAITLGVLFQNVWALVFGTLAGRSVALLASYLIHDYRPRPAFDRGFAAELFGYGKWIMGSGFVLFLLNQGDDAFVGWFLSATALGFYQMAYRFSNAPATEISHVISSVAFPTYAQIKTETARLREGFVRTLQLTTLVSFPMAVGIVLVAPSFVRTFLGTDWLPIVPVMQILAVWGLMRSVVSMLGPLFQAIDHPEYSTFNQALRLLFIAVFIYPATNAWGIEGTALVIVGSALFQNPIGFYMAAREIDATLRELAHAVAHPALGSVVMGVAVLGVDRLVPTTGPVEFAALVATGVVVYVAVMFAVERVFTFGLTENLETIVTAMR